MSGIRMSVHVSGKRLSSRDFVDSILNKMKSKTVPEIRALFAQTTEGWKNKLSFSFKTWSNSDEIGTEVYPDGDNAEQYKLVSLGSPPHPIRAKNGPLLHFQTGYRASTSPGRLLSRANFRSGPWMSAPSVNHPGFEARNFPEAIKEEYNATFVRDMQEAINEAVK